MVKRIQGLGLKSLAIFEAAKGLLVLAVGAGGLAFIHRNLQVEAADIVKFFHLNPARHYPDIFLKTITHLDNTQLWFLSISAILYAVIRMAEAYGLWIDQAWAVWFALASDAIFLPMELYELIDRVTAPRLFVLLFNVVLLIYLVHHLRRARSRG
jgi:uncharacterized membrane protein (DUF2068 family)